MFSTVVSCSPRVFRIVATATVLWAVPFVAAEDKLSEPILRVANETPAAASSSTVSANASPVTQVAPAAADATKVAFDLAQQPGEHALAPVLRTLKATQEEIDRNVHDYSCTFFKQERIDGELGEQQQILMKVRHEPFSVYMSFLKPYAGREVLYVDGQNERQDGRVGRRLQADAGQDEHRSAGDARHDGPEATRSRTWASAISPSSYRRCGRRNAKFAECEVTTNPHAKVAGRSATMIQVVHPVPRQDFKFYAARLFLDNELKDSDSLRRLSRGPSKPGAIRRSTKATRTEPEGQQRLHRPRIRRGQ